MKPIKLYPFNADKSYFLSYGSKIADSDKTLDKFIKEAPANIINARSDKRELPFYVCAGVGNGAVYVDCASTRFFFILEAPQTSSVINGLSTAYEKAIKRGESRPDGIYNQYSVKSGDSFAVSAGTPFMLGVGISYIEVYSSSGKLMPFDPDSSCRTVAAPLLKKPPFHNSENGFSVEVLCTCSAFTAAKIGVVGEYKNKITPSSFEFIFGLEGSATLKTADDERKIGAGDCLLLPADMGEFSLTGGIEMIIVTR